MSPEHLELSVSEAVQSQKKRQPFAHQVERMTDALHGYVYVRSVALSGAVRTRLGLYQHKSTQLTAQSQEPKTGGGTCRPEEDRRESREKTRRRAFSGAFLTPCRRRTTWLPKESTRRIPDGSTSSVHASRSSRYVPQHLLQFPT